MKAVVADRGQVTIPKALRQTLGIDAGTVLEFAAENGRLVAVKHIDDPVAAVYGCLKGRGASTDDVLAIPRGER